MHSKSHYKEDTVTRQHAKGLPHQGQLVRLVSDGTEEIWSEAISCLQLVPLNLATDTPHNSNLDTWRKGDQLANSCKLCGRKQTLIYILNDCPTALELKTIQSLS